MDNIRIKKIDDTKIIAYLTGRIDVVLADKIEASLNEIADDKKVTFMLLNMKDVEYMSSSGFRVAISLLRKLKDRNGILRICNLKEEVQRIFDLIELTPLFEIFDSEKKALST